MNKIININLASRLIPIDETAYDKLRTYIEWLKQFFGREEGGHEIVHDMEDRIGELFQDTLKKGATCITLADVEHMISIMGSPEQIVNEAGEEENTQGAGNTGSTQTESRQSFQPKHPKRLHRSEREKVVGGVCGGIAAYFNLDPAIVRIIFALVSMAWGTGILIYLLLWAFLPVSYDQPVKLQRRLYRNPEHKVAGGVCSGIAAYLNIDPIIPRLIFVAPLLGITFFGILNHNVFFFPAFVGGLPTFVLLYIVLWASLPEAQTVAQKLEMRGEKVDVQSLSQAIKSSTEEDPRPYVKRKNGFASFIAVIVKIFVFFVLGIVVIVLASMIIGLLAALFGLTVSSAFAFPLTHLVTDSVNAGNLLWICAIIVLLIPFIAIIRLLVRLISGRKRPGNRYISIIMTVLFIAAIFGLFWIGGTVINDFKVKYRKTDELALMQPVNDTIYIRQTEEDKNGVIVEYDYLGDENGGIRFNNDTSFAISNISFTVAKSPDSLYHLMLERSAYGSTREIAQKRTEPLTLQYRQEGNIIYLPKDFIITDNTPFRGQQLEVELQVPQGKVFKVEDLIGSYYSKRSFSVHRGHVRYKVRSYNPYDDDKYYQMGTDGVKDMKEDDQDDADSEY